MVTIAMKYTGQLHCEAVHAPSGTQITTDAPKDNMGLGESFSPTDLVATALGTCILTTMAIVANKMKLNMDGATARTEKVMQVEPYRRIGKLLTEIVMPTGIPVDARERLEHAAHSCPVHKSLHPDIDAPIRIVWG